MDLQSIVVEFGIYKNCTSDLNFGGTDPQKIIQEAQKLLDDTIEYERMSKAHNPYGDGKACQRILEFLRDE